MKKFLLNVKIIGLKDLVVISVVLLLFNVFTFFNPLFFNGNICDTYYCGLHLSFFCDILMPITIGIFIIKIVYGDYKHNMDEILLCYSYQKTNLIVLEKIVYLLLIYFSWSFITFLNLYNGLNKYLLLNNLHYKVPFLETLLFSLETSIFIISFALFLIVFFKNFISAFLIFLGYLGIEFISHGRIIGKYQVFINYFNFAVNNKLKYVYKDILTNRIIFLSLSVIFLILSIKRMGKSIT